MRFKGLALILKKILDFQVIFSTLDSMDFKDKLLEHYGFTERDWNETIGRY